MNTSEAYDLSRFEAKPQRAQKKPELKAVHTESAKKSQAKSFSPVVSVLLTGVLVFVCAYMIYTRVMITETTAKISRVNKEIVTLQSEQIRLNSELDAIMTRSNIEQRALELGMYQADKLQVECIEVNEGDRIEVLGDTRGFFAKASDFIKGLF